MDIDDLKVSLDSGTTIDKTAELLCRSGSVDEVERKARELNLPNRRSKP